MIYLDNAATSFPKPKEVLEEWMDVSENYSANPGRSGHKLALKMDRKIFETRSALTKLIGGENPMNTIFTFNCTQALNMAIKGVAKKGSHVITTSLEHNSVLRPLFYLEKQGIIELTVVEANNLGLLDPEQIEAQIRDNTDMIVTTHVSNLVGTILDIKRIAEIARASEITYIVDIAQSIGHMPIDVGEMGLDIVCFPGHKGLLSPMGTGGMYIREGIELESLFQGGTGSFSSDPEQPELYPDRLESGTENGPGLIAMGKGIEYINSRGIDNIHRHLETLKNLFIEEIIDHPLVKLYGPLDERQAAVVSLNVSGMDSSSLGYILSEEYDIYIRPGLHCAPLAHKSMGTTEIGMARFSFGIFNTEEEVVKAADAVKEIAESRLYGNFY